MAGSGNHNALFYYFIHVAMRYNTCPSFHIELGAIKEGRVASVERMVGIGNRNAR